MRLLVLADQPPPTDPAELVAANRPDAIVTLGDLDPALLAPLADLGVPWLGVHGNHDGADDLARLGARDLHLSRAEVGGWSFSGFGGCVHYRDGPHQFTQDQAAALMPRLPGADVLACHCPPLGINDDPRDVTHTGFRALAEWVGEHRPGYLLHGHTTPDPRRRTRRVGDTEVVWVRGARVVELTREKFRAKTRDKR